MNNVKQFRFYDYNNTNNYGGDAETTITYNSLVNGSLFGDETAKMAQIGIQGMPGTKFYLNGGRAHNYGVIIGKTGIYELNAQELGLLVKSLAFDGESIDRISRNPNACLIVDIIYSNTGKNTKQGEYRTETMGG